MRHALLGAVIAACTLLAACDECAGTPSCGVAPEISYSGQFIERISGIPVGGVAIRFMRQSGVDLALAVPSTTSDADGFFTLRSGALQEGVASGELHVVPPAPYQPFTIPDVTLETKRVRGDGGNFGRLVVNPYLFLVGHVRDRKTLTPLKDVQVTMRRIGGGRADQDSMSFVTDHGGQFGWEPRLVDPGTIDAEFEMEVSGHPRPYVVRRALPLKYRDLEMTFVILPVGWGLAYSAVTVRRGSDEPMSGVTVEFKRLAGINTQPSQGPLPVDSNGTFSIAVEPLSEGTVTAELRILPPPPLRPETSLVVLETSDDDEVRSLGYFRYGAQASMNAELRDADTGQPLSEGTVVAVKRAAGVLLAWTTPPADSGLRSLNAQGKFSFQAPTADSGSVLLDFVVRLPAPFAWDTISSVSVPARYSDASLDLGALSVRKRLRP